MTRRSSRRRACGKSSRRARRPKTSSSGCARTSQPAPRFKMNFDLTEEQRRIRETLTDFAEREIKPHSTEWDKGETFPRHIVQQLGQLGFLGVAFPEKFGGGGADTLSQALVVERLSRFDAAIRLTC